MRPAMIVYRAHEKTPGQVAYEADIAARPYYERGQPRATWQQLSDIARWSWERNPTPRYDQRFTSATPRTVTVTDSERVIWTGPYMDFQRANLDGISVSDWCLLAETGSLEIGGGSAPHYRVTLSKPLI